MKERESPGEGKRKWNPSSRGSWPGVEQGQSPTVIAGEVDLVEGR